MPVAELLSRISSRELTEWMAYDRMEPFGEQRADLRTGIIASTFANANRGKSQRVFTPQDFMAFITKPKQTIDQMKDMLTAFCSDNK